jgi:hypothetical protein
MASPIAFSYLSSTSSITSPIAGSYQQDQVSPIYNGDSIYPGYTSVYCPANVNDNECIWHNGNMSSKGTIELWFKPDGWSFSGGNFTGRTNSGTAGIMSYDHFNVNGDIYKGTVTIYWNQGSGLAFDIATVNGYFTTIYTGDVMAANVWRHYAITWDNTANPSVKCYINSELVASANHNIGSYTNQSARMVLGGIAKSYGGTTYSAKGWITGHRHFNNEVKTDFSDRFLFKPGFPEPKYFAYNSDLQSIKQPVKGSSTINGSYTGALGPGIDNTCPNGQPALYIPSSADGHGDELTDYPELTIDPFTTRGTIEFWFKLNGWSWSGTSSSDSGRSHTLICGKYTQQGNGTYAGLIWSIFHHGQGLYTDLYDAPSPNGHRITHTNLTFNADTWYHFAMVWEYGAVNKHEQYIDGILKGTSKSPEFASQFSVPRTTTIGMRTDNLGSPATYGLKGWVSAPKYYDFPKRDFTDRFDIRANMNDQITIT